MEEDATAAAQQHQRDALFGPNPRRASSPPSPRTQHSHQWRGDHNRELQSQGQAYRFDGSRSYAGGYINSGWDNAAVGHQQQQQQLSWEQVRDRVDVAERHRGLRAAHESVEVGRETLETLQDQKERLERSEMVLDSTRYAIERSARVLRGMNFWGKIRNAFTDDIQIPESYRASSASGDASGTLAPDDTPAEGFICPECRRRFNAADSLVTHYTSDHSGNVEFDENGGGGGNSSRSAVNSRASAGEHADSDIRKRAIGTRSEILEARGDRQEFAGGGINSGGGSTVVDGGEAPAGSIRDQLFGSRGESQISGGGGGGRQEGRGRAAGGSGVVAEQKAVMAEQDQYLDDVGRAVAELGLLGRNIGASLDEQGDTLGRVVEKSEDSNDRMAFVTRKAARQAQKAKPKKPTFVTSVALQEVSTGLFVTVTGEDAVLRERELRNVCRFDVWQRQEGILGFKSSVTGRWLGQTFLGYLRVTGNSFSSNCEWQADLRRKETTMICCSANWGAGGYLSVRSVIATSTSTSESPSLPPPPPSDTNSYNTSSWDSSKSHGNNATNALAAAPASSSSSGASPQTTPTVLTKAELTLIDATALNKHRAGVFRVINCDGYIAQPYVGGRLMRPPAGSEGGGRGWVGGGATTEERQR